MLNKIFIYFLENLLLKKTFGFSRLWNANGILSLLSETTFLLKEFYVEIILVLMR